MEKICVLHLLVHCPVEFCNKCNLKIVSACCLLCNLSNNATLPPNHLPHFITIKYVTDRISNCFHTSIHLSTHLSPLYLSNRLNFGLDLLHVCGSIPWIAGIETVGHRSRSRMGLIDWLSKCLTSHSTHNRSFRWRSSQPISWLVLRKK